MIILLFIVLVTYIYFLYNYIQNVQKDCTLSNKNQVFADFYFYYFIIVLVIGIVYPFITPFLKLSQKQTLIISIGYSAILLVLNLYLYQFIDEVQDKCRNNYTLHTFGKVFRFLVILNMIGNSLGFVYSARTLAKTF